MVGVLALIVARALWGVRVNVKASEGPPKSIKDLASFSALGATPSPASKTDLKTLGAHR